MKKVLLFILLGLTFTLAACADSEPTAPADPVAPETDAADPVEDTDDAVDASENGDDASESSPSQPSDDPYSDPVMPSDGNDNGGYGSGDSSGSTGDSENGADDTTSDDDIPTDEDTTSDDDIPTDEDGQYLLTLSQLSQFDGKEGRRAFIAVAGIVYEVTNSPRWANGIHNGNSSIAAGNDLTRQIDSVSPHGRRVLDGVPVVGRIVQD